LPTNKTKLVVKYRHSASCADVTANTVYQT